MVDKITLGRKGEDSAVLFLEQHGYRIVERNFRTRLGEIDIIARDGKTICFIEVKTRASVHLGTPFEAVTRSKQLKISQMALLYLKSKNLMRLPARFDVIAIINNDQGQSSVGIVKNAFELPDVYLY